MTRLRRPAPGPGVRVAAGRGREVPPADDEYSETVVEPRREVIRGVLRRGVASGELRPGIDVDAALFMLTGAVLARGKRQQKPSRKATPSGSWTSCSGG